MILSNRFFLVGLLALSCVVPLQAMQRGPRQRTKNLYDPSSTVPFKISRSKLDLFLKCPHCFYFDRKLGVKRPEGFPLTLNNAVDALLKKEFDGYRLRQEPHPRFAENHINAIPYKHPDIEKWRDSVCRGIQYVVPNTNLMLYGGIDDVWFKPATDELIIADYKATSKAGTVSIDADWQITYKHQVEIYQWLFRKNGFKVSNTAYFVYCNAKKDRDRFDDHLDFDSSYIPYQGNDAWVEEAVMNAYACLQADTPPARCANCEYCAYLEAMEEADANGNKKQRNDVEYSDMATQCSDADFKA